MFGKFGNDPVFPEVSNVWSIGVYVQVVEQGVSDAHIPKIDFVIFDDFFSRVGAKRGESEYFRCVLPSFLKIGLLNLSWMNPIEIF